MGTSRFEGISGRGAVRFARFYGGRSLPAWAFALIALLLVLMALAFAGSDLALGVLVWSTGALIAYGSVFLATRSPGRRRLIAGMLAAIWMVALISLAWRFPASFPTPEEDSMLGLFVYGFMFTSGIALLRVLSGLPLISNVPGQEPGAARAALVAGVALVTIFALSLGAFVLIEYVAGPLIRALAG
jgi:hypothetical protein